jgi:phosphate uptake regulator
MTKKIADLEVQLSELTHERDDLDAKIEEMIADMADAPPERRTSGDWAPNGALTRKYLELTNRQAEVEKDIIDMSRQIAADSKPSLPN